MGDTQLNFIIYTLACNTDRMMGREAKYIYIYIGSTINISAVSVTAIGVLVNYKVGEILGHISKSGAGLRAAELTIFCCTSRSLGLRGDL